MLGVIRSLGAAVHNIDAVFVGTYGTEIVRNSKYITKFYQINSRDDKVIINLIQFRDGIGHLPIGAWSVIQ